MPNQLGFTSAGLSYSVRLHSATGHGSIQFSHIGIKSFCWDLSVWSHITGRSARLHSLSLHLSDHMAWSHGSNNMAWPTELGKLKSANMTWQHRLSLLGLPTCFGLLVSAHKLGPYCLVNMVHPSRISPFRLVPFRSASFDRPPRIVPLG